MRLKKNEQGGYDLSMRRASAEGWVEDCPLVETGDHRGSKAFWNKLDSEAPKIGDEQVALATQLRYSKSANEICEWLQNDYGVSKTIAMLVYNGHYSPRREKAIKNLEEIDEIGILRGKDWRGHGWWEWHTMSDAEFAAMEEEVERGNYHNYDVTELPLGVKFNR